MLRAPRPSSSNFGSDVADSPDTAAPLPSQRVIAQLLSDVTDMLADQPPEGR